jgi:hypothetical protein
MRCELAKLAAAEKFTSIALPQLATGVGRLDWSAVRPLLDQHLGGLGIPVLVYTAYRAEQQTGEGLCARHCVSGKLAAPQIAAPQSAPQSGDRRRRPCCTKCAPMT